MHELIKKVKGDSLRLDAGFNARDLIDEINELGLKPFVFPKRTTYSTATQHGKSCTWNSTLMS